MAGPPKVVYIVAWGRSGTTLMARVLGEPAGLFPAGELHTLLGRPAPTELRCGCGRDRSECPVWSDVTGRMVAAGRDPYEMAVAYARVVGVGNTARMMRAPDEAYLDAAEELYATLATVTGCRTIVDSTKHPSIAAVLTWSKKIDLYVVHVVRDPRAVAHSWTRKKARMGAGATGELMARLSPHRSTINWYRWNRAGDTLRARLGDERYLRVRYEDFVGAPRETYERIVGWAGEDPAEDVFESSTRVRLSANHTIGGNPGRFSEGSTEVALDDAWRSAQPRTHTLTATLLALPLLRRYGYPLGTRFGKAGPGERRG